MLFLIEDREALEESECEENVAIQKPESNIKKSSTQEVAFKSEGTDVSEQLYNMSQSFKTKSMEMQSPTDIAADYSPKCSATQKASDKLKHLQSVSDKDNARVCFVESQMIKILTLRLSSAN